MCMYVCVKTERGEYVTKKKKKKRKDICRGKQKKSRVMEK